MVNGMFMAKIVEHGQGGSQDGRQFRRHLYVAVGQSVCHHIPRAWSKFEAEVEAD
jgi:hypothetical protein